ncbi:MAG: hypothetical protein SWO11_23700 [Thermodesulfobacteriota bacterium]|nr:hypothetical protein [Thermodesulfobacteriota bacterium]
MRKEINLYLSTNYSNNSIIKDFENKNYGFDVITSNKNMNLLIEYKSRYFITGKTDKILYEYDILVELIQSLPYLDKKVDNNNINNTFSSYKINIAVGWFYKCIADRLVYFRFLDDNLFDIIDLDFRNFKLWIMNNIENYKLQYSDKTTGTINLKIKLKDIPKYMLFYWRYNENN